MATMLKRFKESLKRIFRKTPRENVTIRDIAVEALFEAIDDYADWYSEEGLLLPPDYATAPTDWNIALQKMQRAFRLLYEEARKEGDFWEAKHAWDDFKEQDKEKIEQLNKEIEEGLALFGKCLFYLTDTKKTNL